MATQVVLLVPENKGISLERLVGACVETSKLSGDSQELVTAGARTIRAIRKSLDLLLTLVADN